MGAPAVGPRGVDGPAAPVQLTLDGIHLDGPEAFAAYLASRDADHPYDPAHAPIPL